MSLFDWYTFRLYTIILEFDKFLKFDFSLHCPQKYNGENFTTRIG